MLRLPLRELLRLWPRLSIPGVAGALFWEIYEVRGVWMRSSVGEGGADASRGYWELSGASERLWRLG